MATQLLRKYLIRNELFYYAIVKYIENNPAHWNTDEYR